MCESKVLSERKSPLVEVVKNWNAPAGQPRYHSKDKLKGDIERQKEKKMAILEKKNRVYPEDIEKREREKRNSLRFLAQLQASRASFINYKQHFDNEAMSAKNDVIADFNRLAGLGHIKVY